MTSEEINAAAERVRDIQSCGYSADSWTRIYPDPYCEDIGTDMHERDRDLLVNYALEHLSQHAQDAEGEMAERQELYDDVKYALDPGFGYTNSDLLNRLAKALNIKTTNNEMGE